MERLLPAYQFGQLTFRLLFRTCHGMRVEGLEHVPDQGSCLIACNHQSYLDPPLMAAAIPHRQVFFMAKQELFAVPLLGPFLRACGCFSVDRGSGDHRAVDLATELLQQGRLVGIYPEGTRSKDGKLRSGRAGAAVLALRTGAPLVPAAVFNTEAAMRRRLLPGGPPMAIRFGPPMTFAPEAEPSRARLLEVRDQIMSGISALIEEGLPARPGARKETS